ncbi:MAG: malonyl-CoA synthase [Pseudomonadales bacterium]|nr:malonyl-CoA synthase [Pseudomonadales bacterium]
MTNHNVYEHFRRAFQDGGTFIRSAIGDDLYSYGDLDELSGRYASLFRSLGLNPGDRVIVQIDKCPEALMIYFGCLRAGLVYLPLNTAYREHELEYFIEDAEPSLIVCAPESEDFFMDNSEAEVRTLDSQGKGSVTVGLAASDSAFEPTECAADDTAVILYTSGTTGRPKGAMITHGNLLSNATTLHRAWGWCADDVMLHALPIFHIHGLFVATHLPVLNASPIIFLDHFDPATVIELLPEATVYMGVPTNYTRLLTNPNLNRDICRNMRLFTSGSAPLLAQTFHEFHERTGHTIVERYGMTETGMNTSNPLGGPRKPGTVGPPLEGVDIRIVDDENTEVKTGEPGNLLVKGDNVFKGYWRMPGKTNEEFTADGFFKTGDMASIDDDGYVSIVGRSKDMIISGGLNVYPKEVEIVINEIAGVKESAVIGIPDEDFGELVTAIVVPEDSGQVTEKAIISYLKNNLANFKVAKRVHFVEELPRNTMGKVQKNLLRENFSPPESEE